MARLVGQTRRASATWLILAMAAIVALVLAYTLVLGYALPRL